MKKLLLPIKTNRLYIRRLNRLDHPNFLKFVLSDESTQYLPLTEQEKTLVGATKLFDEIIANYLDPEAEAVYAIADKKDNSYIGYCGILPYDDNTLECIYGININYRNQGFATEALKAFVYDLLGDGDVRVFCHPQNLAAHAVAKKCGFTLYGSGMHKHSQAENDIYALSKLEETAA